ncbi:hypothetical protein D8674_029723 [Pyrus ussuriensis x Pyrus communis]|uniref:Uncharacterized protein n=1 Tax=Pyrus ussuriensis x Pyrus communis TaxID=2448454 RepID=A0A5N5HZY3_9ROSA|nr:hypothetical protein D8674_029723 [Pyrus ussuriensis x Pyrus communis]
MTTGQVQLISVLKACPNFAAAGGSISPCKSPTTLVGPPELKLPTSPPLPPRLHSEYQPAWVRTPSAAKSRFRSFGNPFLDIFFHAVGDTPTIRKYLKQLLPFAWSLNPLTTLKVICSLQRSSENVPAFAEPGKFEELLEVLYRNVDVNGEGMRRMVRTREYEYHLELIQEKVDCGGRIGSNKRKEMMDMARKAVEMYKRDPNYQLLHERVSDLYAECLKSDIQNLKEYEKEKMADVVELRLTTAARWCPSVDSYYDRATLLCESIARKVFLREKGSQGVGVEEEADYGFRVREQLMNEVLEPLRRFMNQCLYDDDDDFPRERRSYAVKKYWMDVKAGNSKIEGIAMRPDEIICRANNRNFEQLADPQWKAMVEEIYLKQGKLKNCLAVCDVSGRMCGHPMNVSLGLGLLVSELSEEPWKGKVFTFSRNPQLLTIQGDDLKSKCVFMRRMDNQDWHGDVDFQKVFDLILEVASNENLKPEQMIRRLYVFTRCQDFDDASANNWKTDYKAIQRKFKEKGYGDVVPQIVYWDMNDDYLIPWVRYAEQGVSRMSGDSNEFVQFLLDNGVFGPDHVMEAAFSGKQFQSLAVVD